MLHVVHERLNRSSLLRVMCGVLSVAGTWRRRAQSILCAHARIWTISAASSADHAFGTPGARFALLFSRKPRFAGGKYHGHHAKSLGTRAIGSGQLWMSTST